MSDRRQVGAATPWRSEMVRNDISPNTLVFGLSSFSFFESTIVPTL